ncbi:MAG: hypothetical protein AB1473_07655 [Thermodesulfobacteriota bacterium]
MKAWAEKRGRQMEAMGEKELAELFQLVVRIYELEERLMERSTNSCGSKAA